MFLYICLVSMTTECLSRLLYFVWFLNCRVTAVSGQYQIGIYSLRPIEFGEEITFDYNSVTEVSFSFLFHFLPLLLTSNHCISRGDHDLFQSKEEYEASVCLCGSQVCRGSYLNLTGEGAFQKVYNAEPVIELIQFEVSCMFSNLNYYHSLYVYRNFT